MIDYQRLLAEMQTVETAAERKAIWDLAQREAWGMAKVIAEHDMRNIKRHRRRLEKFRAWPWWRRLGHSEYDVPMNDHPPIDDHGEADL